MKINLVKVKYDDTHCYKHKSLVFCCSELKNAYEDRYGDYPDIVLTNEHIWTNEDIAYNSLYLCISQEVKDFYNKNYIEARNYPIVCCPYCGKEINYFTVEEKDYSKLYKTLVEISNELQERAEITDSRKEYKELCNYRELILEGINAFKDINDYNKFKEKISIAVMHGILAITDKIIKEKEKENESKETDRNEL